MIALRLMIKSFKAHECRHTVGGQCVQITHGQLRDMIPEFRDLDLIEGCSQC